jgi:hypothetical protein
MELEVIMLSEISQFRNTNTYTYANGGLFGRMSGREEMEKG